MHLESWCNKHTKKVRTVKFNALKKQAGFITGTERIIRWNFLTELENTYH